MLSDPLTITYNGNNKTLARIAAGKGFGRFRTSDGEFEVNISNYTGNGPGSHIVGCRLTRVAPDATPSDAFDPYRNIRNSVELRFEFDETRFEASTVIPLLRTALTSFLDTTMTNRLIAGEK